MGQEIYPNGIYEILTRLKDNYGNPPVMITENGASFADPPVQDGRIEDTNRIGYLREYLRQISRAIQEGCDARGYFAWSLTDNFEWSEGFSQHFGLVKVNFETQKRTIKESGYWYRDLIQSKGRPYND